MNKMCTKCYFLRPLKFMECNRTGKCKAYAAFMGISVTLMELRSLDKEREELRWSQ